MFAGAPFLAIADSFCEYEAGLIGTKGIGYIAPYSAVSSDADYDYETKVCRMPIYASPDAEHYRMVDCLDIEAFPVLYHTQDAFVSGLAELGFPITFSDYYAFMVYEWQRPFGRVQLRNGQAAWIKSRHGLGGDEYTRTGVVGLHGQTSSPQLFQEADRSALAPAPDIEGPIALGFLKLLFDDIGTPLEIPEDEWNWFIQSKRDDYYYGFTYIVTDLLEDENGALWYVTSEHLTIDALTSEERHNELQDLLNAPKRVPYSSPVIRTVYIPFRDNKDIVQSVFFLGPYCD